MRSSPPLGSLTPSLSRPAPRRPSSMRETVRAFWPSSVDSRLKRSISSMTSIGSRTVCSSKLSSEWGSWSKTLVSRMYFFFTGDGFDSNAGHAAVPFLELRMGGGEPVMARVKEIGQHAVEIEIHETRPLIQEVRFVDQHLLERDQPLF